MDSLKIAATLRVLANAFESEPGTEAPQPVAEPAKRGRGRPAKGEDVVAPAATQSTPTATVAIATPVATSVEADPFASAPAPAVPTATLDDVRTALTALRTASSQEIALQVLKEAGGASNLTDLKAENYGKVVVAARIKGLSYEKAPAPAVEVDPFATEAAPAATTEKALTVDDVRAVVVATSKHVSQDKIAQVVMSFGGKAPKPEGGEGPSWKALPEANYAAVIAALKALPQTK